MVHVTALGHASVLIDLGGFRLLCDPVLGGAIGVRLPGVTVGPRRLRAPALRVHELPPIDAVLLSHGHMDHVDRYTLDRLPRSATAIVQTGMRDFVRRFAHTDSLPWGASREFATEPVGAVRITAVPSKHWGARMVVDRWRGFGGYLIEALDLQSPSGTGPLSILFAGDTALTDHYRELRARRGRGVDLALFPIGAYDPWIMNHCSPEQAWAMAICDLGAERLLPIHYDTFRLSKEPIGEPLARLHAAADQAGERDRICGTTLGEAVEIRPGS